MIFRTLLFLVVMYFLVKVISRLFLSSNKGKKTRNSARVFFRTFQQFAEQQNRQQKQHSNKQQPGQQQGQTKAGSQRFEEIEEAEFEDVTDDEKSSSK